MTLQTTAGELALPALHDDTFPTAAAAPGPTQWTVLAQTIARIHNKTVEQAENFLATRRHYMGDHYAIRCAEAAITKGTPLHPGDPLVWEFVKPAWYRRADPETPEN